MKHLFLVNPAAGKRGSTEALLRRVEEAFSPLGLEHEVVLTSSAGDAEQLARRAACSGGPVRIYACGGDGTLNGHRRDLCRRGLPGGRRRPPL